MHKRNLLNNLYYTFFLITLFNILPLPTYAIEERSILESDIREDRIEELLQKILYTSKEKIENAMTNQDSSGQGTIEMINVGANRENCSPELLAVMTLSEAWQKCPGLPLSFLKKDDQPIKKKTTGGIFGWAHKLKSDLFEAYQAMEKPIPMEINVGGLQMREIALGEPKVSCNQNQSNKIMVCQTSFSLERFNALINLNMKNLYLQPEVGINERGKTILDFSPIEFGIKKREHLAPTLDLTFKLIPDYSSTAPLHIVAHETKLTIPAGTINFKLPNGQENIPLNQLLTTGHLNFNGDILSNFFVGIGKYCNKTLSDFCEILGDMEKSLSETLQDEHKMYILNNLINKHSGIIELIKKSLEQLDAFHDGMIIGIPKASAQDVLDYVIIIRSFDIYTQHLLEILAKQKRGDFKIVQFEKYNLTLSDILTNIEQTNITLYKAKLDDLLIKLSEIGKLSSEREEKDEIMNFKKRVRNILKEIKVIETTKPKELLAKITITLQNKESGRYLLGIQDISEKGSKKRTKLNLKSINLNKDMNIKINAETLNLFSKRLHEKNKFHLCFIKDNTRNPFNICSLHPKDNQIIISAQMAPHIIFEQDSNKMGIEVPLAINDGGVEDQLSYKLIYDLNKDTTELVSNDSKQDEHKQLYLNISKSFLGLILKSFPLINKTGIDDSIIEKYFSSDKKIDPTTSPISATKNTSILDGINIEINQSDLIIGANLQKNISIPL